MKSTEVETKLAKHDREIDAIRSLIRSGMRLILRIEQAQLQNDRQISQLLASQQNTEKRLQGLIKAIERGRNGNAKLQ
jgi:hypothetical protein